MENKETPEQLRHRQAREHDYNARVLFMKELANRATTNQNWTDPLNPNYMGLVPTHTKIMTVPTPSPGY